MRQSRNCPKRSKEEKVYQFLIGLDDAFYSNVRFGIIQQEPILKIKQVLAMILKEEQHKHLTTTANDRHGVAFAATKSNDPRVAFTSLRTCSHSHKLGHDITICFQLHGYPE